MEEIKDPEVEAALEAVTEPVEEEEPKVDTKVKDILKDIPDLEDEIVMEGDQDLEEGQESKDVGI